MAATTGQSGEKSSEHWAYRPVLRPEVPRENGGIPGNEVDFFLGKTFADGEVTPNPEADRHTLMRRLSLSLIGLAPTPGEIRDFVSDDAPDAYEKVVERLLDSPHYGEKWGRHWLDIARYVQGTVKVPGVDRIDLAEEYRDYVVRAFNADKPYDRFVTEQLAGDLLSSGDRDRRDRLAAPALLSIGPWFDECTDPNKLKLDIADEQISTVTKAFLALDFGCARCHDHKADPIPTRDYYALAGIFRSTRITGKFSDFWKDGRPRLTRPDAAPGEIEKAGEARAAIESLRREKWRLLTRKRRDFLARYSESFEAGAPSVPRAHQLKAWEAEDFSGHKNLVTVEGKYTPAIETRVPLEQWVQYDFHLDRAGEFLLYLRYASPVPTPLQLELNRKLLSERLPLVDTGGKEYQHYRWEAFGPFPFRKGQNRIRLMTERHEMFPRLDALKIVADTRGTADSALDRAMTRYSHSRTFWPPMISEMELVLSGEELREVREIDGRIGQLRGAATLPETLAVTDAATMITEPVRAGGQVYQPEGEPVPRAVPTMFSPMAEKYPIPSEASGRLQFARWITDPDNPLTARVMVNRIWHWHFGKGIVESMDNFGRLGAKPENRELLDWLAAELMDSGWSIKHIQRKIVLSRAFRRSSAPARPGAPLLTAFPKRRLEAETLYDMMLATSGKLPRQPSGTPLDPQLSRDRALYILVSGRSPKGLGLEIRKMFDLFGFDDSGRPIHDRPDAVTPDQALWFLNNPLPAHYADRLAERLLEKENDPRACLTDAFLTAVAHPPSERERNAASAYLTHLLGSGSTEKEALSRVILGIFSSEQFTHLH